MRCSKGRILAAICLMLSASFAAAQEAPKPAETPSPSSTGTVAKPAEVVDKAPPTALSKEAIPKGSKIYVAPISGYETYIVAGLMKKDVPVIVVNSREKADYEISGVSESHQAGWAKMFFMGSQASAEQASIVMTNLKTGVAVWGYNVNKSNSYKGKQSSAEACAKHLKARIEGRE